MSIEDPLEYFKKQNSFIYNDMVDIWNKHHQEAMRHKIQRIELDKIMGPAFLEMIIKFKKELGVL